MENASVRVLCPKLVLYKNEPAGLQWLIGSPFLPPLTVVSTLKCTHTDSSSSPDYTRESEELRTLLLKGFHVIGALIVANSNDERTAGEAIAAARRLRKLLCDEGEKLDTQEVIGAVAGGDIRFFVSKSGNSTSFECVDVLYEDDRSIGQSSWACRVPLPFTQG